MKKKVEKVRVELGERSYDIIIGSNILSSIGVFLKPFGFSPKVAVVSNPTVYPLYGGVVATSLEKAGFDILTVTIPDGEEYKDLLWVEHIYNMLLKAKLDRSSCIVALGGGVIGDITGFVASTYMRGISYIQMPTTLLAQVDSSVGGKTGVNHKLGKNMIGTFWQPRLVRVDVETLKTLQKREFLAGIAEVIKYGVIWDEELFDFLEAKRKKILNLDREALMYVIKRSCEIKAEVVSKDERESGLRAILNFGHTIGHAIETVTGYRKYLHGEAVAIGMHLEAKLAGMLNLFDDRKTLRIKALIDAYNLPSEMPQGIDVDHVLSAMELDKKAVAGKLRFVLPEKIGKVRIQKGVAEKVIRDLLKS
ncbi:MAG: 3-dehydroquinate synthase [Nitrospirae bacterium RBG_13_43_8]|nr:MAG: 3-dehydroquinate synthase [Nitrospirae bacterium RBG_13_43_8]